MDDLAPKDASADQYEWFGFKEEPENGYDQTYKNVTLQSIQAPICSQISLSLRNTSIGGQGLCALAVLAKLNKQVKYVALEGNTLNVEYG